MKIVKRLAVSVFFALVKIRRVGYVEVCMRWGMCALCCGVFMVAIVTPVSANEFAAVDAYVDAAPASVKRSVDALADYLSKAGDSDLEHARALYRWITKNIVYNFKGLESGNLGDTSPAGVLKNGKAVCGGYSNLAVAVGSRMGLEIEFITGWIKGGPGYTLGQKIYRSKTDPTIYHAWNAVRINGEWQLMDSTWGTGCSDSSGSVVCEFDEQYFLTNPNLLVFSHWPEDKSWQLLPKPITFKEFNNLVKLSPEAFATHGLELRSHRDIFVNAKDRFTVTFGAPANIEFLAHLTDSSGNRLARRHTFIERVGDEVRINGILPKKGKYTLDVFAKPKSQRGNFSPAASYLVRASKGNRNGGFPVMYSNFNAANGLELRSHRDVFVDVDERFTVTIGAPADLVFLADLFDSSDNKLAPGHTFVERVGDEVRVNGILPKKGEYTLTVYAKPKSQKGTFPHFASYLVRASKGAPNGGFPTTYSTFAEGDAHLYAPMDGTLARGQSYDFKIRVPWARRVAVIVDGEWTQLESDSDHVFSGTVTASGAKATIAARWAAGNGYHNYLVEYQVR